MSGRGTFCGGSSFLDRKGNCRNPDGCTCDTIAALRSENERLVKERDEAKAEKTKHIHYAARHFAKSCALAERALSAEAKLATMREAGRQLANVAYNLHQLATLKPKHAKALKEAQEAWDAALAGEQSR